MPPKLSKTRVTLDAKIALRDSIIEYLYVPFKRHRQRQINQLAEQNALVGGFSHNCFFYRGKLFSDPSTPIPEERIPLMEVFWPTADEWFLEDADLAMEVPLITGGLNRILSACNDARDVLLILPETIARPVHEHEMALVSDKRLEPDKIAALKAVNEPTIQKLCERMVLNLIL